jgi:hypothetical protein
MKSNKSRKFIYSIITKFSFFVISERPEVKDAAINALHEKERENKIHHFKETDRLKHLSNWE